MFSPKRFEDVILMVCISTQRFDDFFRGRFITRGGLFGGLAKQLFGETLAIFDVVLRGFPANAESHLFQSVILGIQPLAFGMYGFCYHAMSLTQLSFQNLMTFKNSVSMADLKT